MRSTRTAWFAVIGVALVLFLGWRLRRFLAEDSCLDIGGTWHAESGTCGGMPTPVP